MSAAKGPVAKSFEITEDHIRDAKKIVDADQRPVPVFWINKYEREAAKNWNTFYKHNTINFFKDRQYFAHEFPEVFTAVQNAQKEGRRANLVEIGCGVGNTLMPLLRAHPTLDASGFDYAENAVRFLYERYAKEAHLVNHQLSEEQLQNLRQYGQLTVPETEEEKAAVEKAAEDGEEDGVPTAVRAEDGEEEQEQAKPVQRARMVGPPLDVCERHFEAPKDLVTPQQIPEEVYGEKMGRLQRVCVLDASKQETPLDICEEGQADLVVLMFVLSAIQPADFAFVASQAAKLLRPGGILYIRDYGRFDMAQLRLAQQTRPSRLEDNFYVRGDGTRCYYFEPSEWRTLFVEGAGLEEIENNIFTREIVNRKKDLSMKRIWLQGKFRKPLN